MRSDAVDVCFVSSMFELNLFEILSYVERQLARIYGTIALECTTVYGFTCLLVFGFRQLPRTLADISRVPFCTEAFYHFVS
jgi:hypothetical protein